MNLPQLRNRASDRVPVPIPAVLHQLVANGDSIVTHEDAVKRLRALRDEVATLPPSTSSAEFNSWEPRTRSALARALGEKHYITQRFIKTKWTPSADALGDTIAFTSTFRGTVPEAQGILDAAIAEIELLAEEGPVADE